MSVSPPRPQAAAQPMAQAVALSFRFLVVVVLVLAVAWLFSGLTRVGPHQAAVVLRLGAVQRVVDQPGLVFVAPGPIERAVLVPLNPQKLVVDTHALGTSDEALLAAEFDVRAHGGYLVTADAGMIHARCTLTWHVAQPAVYLGQTGIEQSTATDARTRVETALQRAVASASVQVAAQHPLDALARGGQTIETFAKQLRELVQMRADQLNLGIRIDEVLADLTLPPRLRKSFADWQQADSEAAAEVGRATAEADRLRSEGSTAAQQIRGNARSQAQEAISRARSRVATVLALAAEAERDGGKALPLLLGRLYAERMARILAKVGRLVVLPPGQAQVMLDAAGRPMGGGNP